jgi:ribosomal-protein-alanine N-acetyltransferase
MDATKISYHTVSGGEVSPFAALAADAVGWQILDIALSSPYAASEAATLRFVSDAFSVAGKALILAMHNDVVLGYLELRFALEDAEIDFVAVAPEFRRWGIGKHLVSNAVQHAIAKGGRRVLLEVAESNEAAIALYAQLMFVEIARRKRYYKGKEDALIMERKINAGSAGS